MKMSQYLREENIQELFPLLGRNTMAMQSIARSLHRVQEQLCNGFQTEQAERRAERRQARFVNRAVQLAEMYGVLVYVQGDPRGWPLYIYTAEDLAAKTLYRHDLSGSIDSVYNSIAKAVCPY